MKKYPTNIVSDDKGWHRIHAGHGIDHDWLRADLVDEIGEPGPNQTLGVEEVHFGYVPRVKWCADYGIPCDSDGEWHSHWYSVHESCRREDNAFTLAFWTNETQQ